MKRGFCINLVVMGIVFVVLASLAGAQGSGPQSEAGIQATVPIEPIFAQTVNLTETYHVFLTPLGDCALYVAAKTPALFTVKAMGGQTCSITFDYRIVAKRLGYEGLRLDPAATGAGTP